MKTVVSTFNWTVIILGLISMIILSIVSLLILGVAFGGEPSGSSIIEQLAKFLFAHPWMIITMLVLSGWAVLLYWRKK